MHIREKIVTNPSGTRQVVEKHSYLPDYAADPVAAVVWRVASVLMVLLAIRFVFKLFGANTTGFVAFLYQITEPFVAPFRGIFSSPDSGVGFFDTAAFLGMLMVMLSAWIITSLVNIVRHPEEI